MGVFWPHARSQPPILLRTNRKGSSCPSLELRKRVQCSALLCCALRVQVSIVEHYQHYYRYLERGGADNIYGPWASPEDSRQNCQGWCKSWMYWGYTNGPLPWWGKCYDAANSLNNIVVAIGINQLIPPATKRMVNETQCNRTNQFMHMRYLQLVSFINFVSANLAV